MAPTNYAKDEKVLCFHHDILYEAKILDVRHKDASDKKSPFEYLVHYKGWKNTWDDWVLEDRLRKWSDENRELAANIRREAEASLRAKNVKPGSTTKKRAMSERSSVRDSEERGVSVSGRGGNKRVRENDIEREETFQARPSIRIVMPDNIKSLIVDDWERVTKNGSVVQLPHAKSVYQILQDWRAEELPKRHHVDVSVMDEVIAGLSEYFEVVIDKLLLYRYERHQYRVLKKKYFNNKDKTPLHVYGAEHLIRLMSLLPELLAQTNMEYKSTGRSHEELSKFSIWLSRNSEKYFLTKYVPANEIDEED
ncbi:Chromatin modification-related protein eaf3 [Penicillium pulvis]|uniref:Chromatin modification-related protein eaf3 n=1 Tax=Penicillium pulvis TaxID=1562058 RepID=UPI0025478A2A|nr:Chromatin modification-related protein eaf3 [Penicillium pulvis]KAJ5809581.1 Chromatin modification-related protein eaf3 [Penicillium pulvis]